MKQPVFWLAAGALPISIAIVVLVAFQAEPRSETVAATGGNSADGEDKTHTSNGIASFYGVSTNGTTTASGVPLNDSVSTAAHRSLPFGTSVRVTNLKNGLSEIVRITDRGPFTKGRIIDVSRNAAEKLDMVKDGIVSVEIRVVPEEAEPTRPSSSAD